MNKKIYNFSAGPAILPKEVLLEIKNEFLNWNNIGTSIIEISHRSKEFLKIVKKSKQYLKELLCISDEYKILFSPGGARGQFSAIPMNLLKNFHNADYINTGYWSYNAMLEAKKYCIPKNINVLSILENKKNILPMNKWKISNNSKYIHYCPNETIEGIAIREEPIFDNKIVIADLSSCILSHMINIKKYDLIYASAQKNIGPAGITLIIIHRDLLNKKKNNFFIPSILDYKKIYENDSMFNTPSTFSWYTANLVFKWIKRMGGIKFFEDLNYKKAQLLYQKIDESDFYINDISIKNRSYMNVTFNLFNADLNNIFLKESDLYGLKFLKGHKIQGGFRASIYNSMPLAGVEKLVEFMNKFEKKYG